MQENKVGKQMLSESKFYMGYSRWKDVENRYETWEESVTRVMQMHREKYKAVMSPELEGLISFAEQAYKEKRVGPETYRKAKLVTDGDLIPALKRHSIDTMRTSTSKAAAATARPSLAT